MDYGFETASFFNFDRTKRKVLKLKEWAILYFSMDFKHLTNTYIYIPIALCASFQKLVIPINSIISWLDDPPSFALEIMLRGIISCHFKCSRA